MAPADRIGPSITRDTPIVATDELLKRIDRLERRLASGGGSSGQWYAGQVICSASPNVPAGWLPCDGRALARAEYPALFDAIGTLYGAPDAATFNLPDLRDRIPRCGALGWAGGEDAHTITLAEMPYHDHGTWTGGQSQNHLHSLADPSWPYLASSSGWNWVNVAYTPGGYAVTYATGGNANNYVGWTDRDHQHQVYAQGGNVPHNNIPRAINLNFMIKT